MIKNINFCETIRVLPNNFFESFSTNNNWSLYKIKDKIFVFYKGKTRIHVDIGEIFITMKDSYPSLSKLI